MGKQKSSRNTHTACIDCCLRAASQLPSQVQSQTRRRGSPIGTASTVL